MVSSQWIQCKPKWLLRVINNWIDASRPKVYVLVSVTVTKHRWLVIYRKYVDQSEHNKFNKDSDYYEITQFTGHLCESRIWCITSSVETMPLLCFIISVSFNWYCQVCRIQESIVFINSSKLLVITILWLYLHWVLRAMDSSDLNLCKSYWHCTFVLCKSDSFNLYSQVWRIPKVSFQKLYLSY